MRQEFGDIVHETVVVTEPPQAADLVLRTIATAYPRVRIENLTPNNSSIIQSQKQPMQVECRAFSYGSSTEPAVDLDRMELQSTGSVKWTEPKEACAPEGDLHVESRRFAVTLDSAAPPGYHKTEIVLRHGENCRYNHVLSWEVVAPISVSPKVIVLKAGQNDYHVVVRSRDHSLFRIKTANCNAPGVRVRAATADRADTHTIYVEYDDSPQLKNGRAVVRVTTDHLGQLGIEFPLVVLD